MAKTLRASPTPRLKTYFESKPSSNPSIFRPKSRKKPNLSLKSSPILSPDPLWIGGPRSPRALTSGEGKNCGWTREGEKRGSTREGETPTARTRQRAGETRKSKADTWAPASCRAPTFDTTVIKMNGQDPSISKRTVLV
jgi:hypothetical protein